MISSVPNYGQGQTIVLVDAYGSPTAASDLQTFHGTFFPDLPNPDFQQVFPQGNPQYMNTCRSNGLSGPCAAANWSGEATLDQMWKALLNAQQFAAAKVGVSDMVPCSEAPTQ